MGKGTMYYKGRISEPMKRKNKEGLNKGNISRKIILTCFKRIMPITFLETRVSKK